MLWNMNIYKTLIVEILLILGISNKCMVFNWVVQLIEIKEKEKKIIFRRKCII